MILKLLESFTFWYLPTEVLNRCQYMAIGDNLMILMWMNLNPGWSHHHHVFMPGWYFVDEFKRFILNHDIMDGPRFGSLSELYFRSSSLNACNTDFLTMIVWTGPGLIRFQRYECLLYFKSINCSSVNTCNTDSNAIKGVVLAQKQVLKMRLLLNFTLRYQLTISIHTPSPPWYECF